MCPGLKEGTVRRRGIIQRKRTPRQHHVRAVCLMAMAVGVVRPYAPPLTAKGGTRGGTANGRLCRCTVEQMKLICDSFNTENFMSLMGKAMLAEQKVERWLLAPHRTPLGSRRSNTLQHPTAGSPALYRVSYNRCCDPETHRRRRRQRSHQNAPETPLVLFCAWEVFCITVPNATSPLSRVLHKVL